MLFFFVIFSHIRTLKLNMKKICASSQYVPVDRSCFSRLCNPLTRICVQQYSKKCVKLVQKPPKSDSMDPMKKEKDAFYVVRKGDIVGVYGNLIDCQAQVRNSVCDPPISVFKGYSLCEETVTYLSSFGLRNAIYSLKATDLKDDIFGNLVPCTFHEATVPDVIKKCLKGSCFLEVDGASKGNPGKAGAGVILRDATGKSVCKFREGLGNTTCNVAEYRAMILGLKIALKRGYTHIHVQSDSKLVCMQIQGSWKTNNKKLSQLNEVAKTLKEKFSSFQMTHVLRGSNSEADKQANLGTKLDDGEIQEEDDSAVVNHV